MEQPILSSEFLVSQAANIIEVENGVERETIKDVVSSMPVSVPMYVVERCGKFRGFALTPQLILAGVTATAFFPYAVLEMAGEMNVSLLTREETRVVEKNLQCLLSMMSKVDVPYLTKMSGCCFPVKKMFVQGALKLIIFVTLSVSGFWSMMIFRFLWLSCNQRKV